MSQYFQQRGWYLLEGKLGNKGENVIGGNIYTPIDHTPPHVFVSYKIYFKHKFRTLDQQQRWWHSECSPCLTVTYKVNTVGFRRYWTESVRNSQGRDIWTGFNNHSFAIQKALISPTFTDFHVRLHLKKWPYYIKNSSSGYQKETNEEPMKFTDFID